MWLLSSPWSSVRVRHPHCEHFSMNDACCKLVVDRCIWPLPSVAGFIAASHVTSSSVLHFVFQLHMGLACVPWIANALLKTFTCGHPLVVFPTFFTVHNLHILCIAAAASSVCLPLMGCTAASSVPAWGVSWVCVCGESPCMGLLCSQLQGGCMACAWALNMLPIPPITINVCRFSSGFSPFSRGKSEVPGFHLFVEYSPKRIFL